ncbi:MAG TPA: hypothetical protein VKQ07_10675 [Jatrophihabitantaceae bacterium]|nr:hypothetical protein [Jatrophihabitantaceae bacterium]
MSSSTPVSGSATTSASTSVSLLRAVDLVLNPAVRVLWRGAGCIQLELGSRSVVVDGVDATTVAALLRRPDRPGAAVHAGQGLDLGAFAPGALDALLQGGYLWPAARDAAPLPPPPSARLAADQTALASRHGRVAAALVVARMHRLVAITGRSRVATLVASLLAASGVGHLYFADSGEVSLPQSMPGGLTPDTEGHRFAAAASDAVRNCAPEVETTPPPLGTVPDLTVLAVDEPVDSDLRDALHARGCAHLAVRLDAAGGRVGPLVIPGRTSCLRCADLHRLDRDPAWDALAVQLAVPPRHGAASDVAVAAVIGGVAAVHALAFLDGQPTATAGGTLEMHLPDWRLRRRTWRPHPGCRCGALSGGVGKMVG